MKALVFRHSLAREAASAIGGRNFRFGDLPSRDGPGVCGAGVTARKGRYRVRLSVPRNGGWRAWGPVSGDFERRLSAQEGAAVTGAHIESETRRGRDYVRVTIAITVSAPDVALWGSRTRPLWLTWASTRPAHTR